MGCNRTVEHNYTHTTDNLTIDYSYRHTTDTVSLQSMLLDPEETSQHRENMHTPHMNMQMNKAVIDPSTLEICYNNAYILCEHTHYNTYTLRLIIF